MLGESASNSPISSQHCRRWAVRMYGPKYKEARQFSSDDIKRVKQRNRETLVSEHSRREWEYFSCYSFITCKHYWPIPVAARSIGCWDRSFESREGHGYVSLLFICCVVVCRQRPLRLADHSSRGVLPCVCMCVIKKPQRRRPRPDLKAVEPLDGWINIIVYKLYIATRCRVLCDRSR
jgi:hypothetical protein